MLYYIRWRAVYDNDNNKIVHFSIDCAGREKAPSVNKDYRATRHGRLRANIQIVIIKSFSENTIFCMVHNTLTQ